MGQRSWVAATALCLAVVTAATGPVPRDASAGILAVSCASGRMPNGGTGSVTLTATVDASPYLQGAVSARYPMWAILLLVILLLLVWLIYHTWTGWKPLIAGG